MSQLFSTLFDPAFYCDSDTRPGSPIFIHTQFRQLLSAVYPSGTKKSLHSAKPGKMLVTGRNCLEGSVGWALISDGKKKKTARIDTALDPARLIDGEMHYARENGESHSCCTAFDM